MLLLALSLLAPAFAETDEIGGDDSPNDDGDMLKLVGFDILEAAVITELRFAVYNDRSEGTPVLVLYHQVGDRFELVAEVDATDLPEREEGWATAENLTWVLEPGENYAIGAYIPDSWYYYYDDRTDQPWFGRATGGYRYESREVPAEFEADLEDYYYHMEIDSEDADVDGDGVIAEDYGGLDCDDEDANVGERGEEVPYDGIDQDCDGADLVDVDGDGQASTEAGGEDCDDTDTSIADGAPEVCDDGIDQDCDGTDEACGADNGGDDGGTDNGGDDGGNGDDGGDNGGALDISAAGCGCATMSSGPGLWGALVVAAGLLVRRRG